MRAAAAAPPRDWSAGEGAPRARVPAARASQPLAEPEGGSPPPRRGGEWYSPPPAPRPGPQRAKGEPNAAAAAAAEPEPSPEVAMEGVSSHRTLSYSRWSYDR